MTVAERRLGPRPELQFKETRYDGISYVCPMWDQMGVFNFDLARQIIQSGQSFEGLSSR